MRNRIIAAFAAAGLLFAGSTILTASAAPAPERASAAVAPANTVTGTSVVDGSLYQRDLNPALVTFLTTMYNNSVGSPQVKDGSLGLVDLSPAAVAALKGANGADAILPVTADTMVTGRPDTATDGTVWAKDSMTRTLTVVRQHATKASDCGAGAVKCWYYTGTIRDNGTFTTVAGAHGPNSVTPISGIVEGTVNGVYEIEFNATSDKPNPALVDSTVTGSSPSTSDWMKMAFPAGTQFAGFTGVDYTWVYKAPKTCEVHTQATAANTGDILGVNKC